ncbi:MAG: deoxyuridine 5'-triphosphate nucleotidohydrolase [Clostridia bacterium]|nr:deoxyuridine 5'-triphosphate nucleotidohydrolase [Clostridia bacterium]
MKKVAQFKKVSFGQFEKDWNNIFGKNENLENIYQKIELPQRATAFSAGYDFFSPIAFSLKARESINIPTGIRCNIDNNYVLQVFPRSGLGFKFRLQLNNTVGIIDSDYFYSENEGHIHIKLTNDTNENKIVEISQGQGLAQGIFLEYGITIDDNATATRNGGFGSTTKK